MQRMRFLDHDIAIDISHKLGPARLKPTWSPEPYFFQVSNAITPSLVAFINDVVAIVSSHIVKELSKDKHNSALVDIPSLLSDHDWLRSLRMGSYGFLLYGPGSFAWYQYLDRSLPKHTLQNMLLKVLLNQIVLGPCVIAVVFAWNDFWKGNLSELPKKYKNNALPTLFYGFRFWIPASVLNFWVIPLQARVAFMSTCSIFWNFYLSSTMSK
ncbi:hypothetical protein Scep_027824 [Stephania cephalantha]|uniref:Uncharacterized protein n=1 Tax=Stephania cephalantha TaxID=152367 RepID=A0AAP0EDB8_9MAGN